jgi:hypothetical protein
VQIIFGSKDTIVETTTSDTQSATAKAPKLEKKNICNSNINIVVKLFSGELFSKKQLPNQKDKTTATAIVLSATPIVNNEEDNQIATKSVENRSIFEPAQIEKLTTPLKENKTKPKKTQTSKALINKSTTVNLTYEELEYVLFGEYAEKYGIELIEAGPSSDNYYISESERITMHNFGFSFKSSGFPQYLLYNEDFIDYMFHDRQMFLNNK